MDTTLTCREAALGAMTGARVLSAILATENPVLVRRWDGVTLEVLLARGVEVAPNVPLLVDHSRSIASMVGSVVDVQRENGQVVGQLSFASGTDTAEDAWQLASQRHLRTVSVGYRVLDSVDIPAGRTAVIGGRTFSAPSNRQLSVVTRWTLTEVSLVPVPADAGAIIRSASQRSEYTPMRVAPKQLSSMRWRQFFQDEMRSRGGNPPLGADDLDVVRAGLSDLSTVAAIQGVVNAAILGGFRSMVDTTEGWVRAVTLPNYLPQSVAYADRPIRLQHTPRGGTAPIVSYSVSTPHRWRLAKFTAAVVIDEQDLIDTQPIGVWEAILAELGAAARRLVPDLVWSLVLANPELEDGVPLFDAARANTGNGVVGRTAVGLGFDAIGSQILPDEYGRPTHLNLQPRYLIVPPTAYLTGKRLAQDAGLDDELIVRSESRLGDMGLVSPADEEIIAGNGANWLLAAPAEQAPGVLVGFLNGKQDPDITVTALTRGEWGVHVSVAFSVGATAVDGRGLYWSTGQ